jgi:hypothetical protein
MGLEHRLGAPFVPKILRVPMPSPQVDPAPRVRRFSRAAPPKWTSAQAAAERRSAPQNCGNLADVQFRAPIAINKWEN